MLKGREQVRSGGRGDESEAGKCQTERHYRGKNRGIIEPSEIRRAWEERRREEMLS